MDAAERFWSKVEKGPGCWLWTAGTSRNSRGNRYGKFAITPTRSVGAHRQAYLLAVGPIARGLYVCHRCDNTLCVRPDHLFLGTHDDNVDDAFRKGRLAQRFCRSGRHEMVGDAVRIDASPSAKRGANQHRAPKRRCELCRKERYRKRYDEGRWKGAKAKGPAGSADRR